MPGILYPIIPFDLLVDIDIGIIQLAKTKYIDSSSYYYNILQLPIDILISMLIKRKDINPLSIALVDGINHEVIDDHYKEMINNDYEQIVSLSITTDLFDATRYFIASDVIIPTILCKNEIEANVIKKIKFDKEVAVEISAPEDLNLKYDPIYIKDVSEINRYSHLLNGKNVYIANYRFNFVEDENGDLSLSDNTLEAISGRALPKIVTIYKMNNLIIPKG